MPIGSHTRRSPLKYLSGFFRKEEGAITIESMLILPMVLWSVFASYTYFDGYRQSSRNIKAAYAVADIVSRERNSLTTTYIDTLHDLLETMVSTRAPMSMRVSYLLYHEDEDQLEVLFSCFRGTSFPGLTDDDAVFMKGGLPDMPDNGSMIVVETRNTYRAPFNIAFGFEDFEMNNFVFTHPRFNDQIVPPDDDPQCLT